MIINDAKQLQYRSVVHITDNAGYRCGYSKCARFYVNGKVRTWKRSPERIYIPLKHGLYVYGAVTEHNLHLIHREEDCDGK